MLFGNELGGLLLGPIGHDLVGLPGGNECLFQRVGIGRQVHHERPVGAILPRLRFALSPMQAGVDRSRGENHAATFRDGGSDCARQRRLSAGEFPITAVPDRWCRPWRTWPKRGARGLDIHPSTCRCGFVDGLAVLEQRGTAQWRRIASSIRGRSAPPPRHWIGGVREPDAGGMPRDRAQPGTSNSALTRRPVGVIPTAAGHCWGRLQTRPRRARLRQVPDSLQAC